MNFVPFPEDRVTVAVPINKKNTKFFYYTYNYARIILDCYTTG